MSFWKKLLGRSKDNNLPMEEPEHDITKAPPDDLMVVEKEDKQEDQNLQEESLNNKDSP